MNIPWKLNLTNKKALAALLVLVITAFVGTYLIHRPPLPPEGPAQIKLAEKRIRGVGVRRYPKSKILDGSIHRFESQTGTKKRKKIVTSYAYLWLTTGDSVEGVQLFYQRKNKFNLILQKQSVEETFIQLASVESIAEALVKEKPQICLIDIRRKNLNPSERQMLETEFKQLSEKPKRTLAENARLHELRLNLNEGTLIKITLRTAGS